jgi:hypothetical protein
LNGVLDNGQLVGTITNSQRNSTANINIGGRPGTTFFDFAGRIDDVRIADHALTQAQFQTDMATPLGGTTPPPPDTTFPTVSLTPPASILAGTVNLAAKSYAAMASICVREIETLPPAVRWGIWPNVDDHVPNGTLETTHQLHLAVRLALIVHAPHRAPTSGKDMLC